MVIILAVSYCENGRVMVSGEAITKFLYVLDLDKEDETTIKGYA